MLFNDNFWIWFFRIVGLFSPIWAFCWWLRNLLKTKLVRRRKIVSIMNKLKQEIVHHLSPNGVPLTLVFFDNNLNNLMQLYYKHNKVKTYPESFGLSNGKIVTAHIESKNKLSVFSSNIVSAATSKFLISIDRSIVKSMSGIVCLIDDLARTGESLEMLKSLIEKNNNKCTIFTAAIITSPMAQSVNFSGQEIEGLKRDFYFSWRKKTQK